MKKAMKKIVLLLLTGCLLTCQDDTEIFLETKRLDRRISAAREWYRTNLPGESLLISRGMNNSPLEVKPDWEQAVVTSDKKQRVVETGLFMKGGLFMTIDENRQKFEETGDERYVSSHTRLVIRTKLKNGSTDGFLMTVMPSVEYLELTGFNAFEEVKYIGRD